MNWMLILLLISFPLGQLTRLQLIPGVQVYLHDLVIPFLVIATIKEWHRKKSLQLPSLSKPILIFFIAALTSLVFSSLKANSEQLIVGSLYLVRWIGYATVYFYIKQLKQSGKKIVLFNHKINLSEALLIAGISFSIFGLVQYFFLPDTRSLKLLGWDDHYYRLIGTLLDPSFTGIILVLTLLLSIESKQSKIVKIVSIIFSSSALLLTYSRSSYLALMVGFFVFILLKRKFKEGITAVVLFLSLIFFLPKASSEGTNLLRTYSLFDRLETWNHAIKITKDQPLFGVGFNLLRYVKRDYGFVGEDWEKSHSASGIENSYLFVSATTGICGFLAFIWLLFSMIKPHLKTIKNGSTESIIILSSLAAVSVHAMFNNTWFYSWVMLWIWYLLGEGESVYSS